MSELVIEKVWKEYGDQIVLEDVSLTVAARAFVALVGPSGCGKSTFLRMLLGQERPTKGTILLAGAPLPFEPGPDRGVVFQRYSVFQHLTVLGNVLLGRELSASRYKAKLFGAARRDAVDEARRLIGEVGLSGAEDKYPAQLSGGMISSSASADACGFRLGFERKTADFKNVILRHRRLRAVADVGGESVEVFEFFAAAIDMGHFLAVDQEEVILARPAGDIDIFAQFDVAFGAENGQAAVAPGRQRLRREPVDTDITRRLVGTQKHLAEILEGGLVGHAISFQYRAETDVIMG